jgi:hypothetical protein
MLCVLSTQKPLRLDLLQKDGLSIAGVKEAMAVSETHRDLKEEGADSVKLPEGPKHGQLRIVKSFFPK